MRDLASLKKYFARYRWRLVLGILFVAVSNLFAVLPPVVVRTVIDDVTRNINTYRLVSDTANAAPMRSYIFSLVLWSGILLLGLALLRGFFMFMMRQTIIIMSRHIEYDQKAEIYAHYQSLHTHFFKTHFTGDMMNRISEDVSRVRQYTGPAIMYAINLLVLGGMCIWGMLRVSPVLTIWVVIPFPLLALTIYLVNKIIYKKSENIQAQLSGLTTTAQESYSGIRVIKSFVQESAMVRFFSNTSRQYQRSAINLSLTEAIYFPSMNFFIGLSMLATVLVGGIMVIHGTLTAGHIAEFVIYINLLMFPISSIGWVASMMQRAAASQKRINEFMDTTPEIMDMPDAVVTPLQGEIVFDKLNFIYPHTGIHALRDFSLHIKQGMRVAVIGKTGSGKSTIAHMLLRMYDVTEGAVIIDGIDVRNRNLESLRKGIAFAPQDAFLFSDTVTSNIRFGNADGSDQAVQEAAHLADLDKDIAQLSDGYETVVGERGVMLSGGQRQRLSLARALMKDSNIIILDECLSAVDNTTEQRIVQNLQQHIEGKTVIVITHRIIAAMSFDMIIIMEDGRIAELGSHDELMRQEGKYAALYRHQTGSGE